MSFPTCRVPPIEAGRVSPRVCVEDDNASDEDEVCPRVASTVLYLYVVLDRARSIPGTWQIDELELLTVPSVL